LKTRISHQFHQKRRGTASPAFFDSVEEGFTSEANFSSYDILPCFCAKWDQQYVTVF